MNYRCSVCGCYLDPGEGRICEECQMKIKTVPQMLEHPQDHGTAGTVTLPRVHDNTTFRRKEEVK